MKRSLRFKSKIAIIIIAIGCLLYLVVNGLSKNNTNNETIDNEKIQEVENIEVVEITESVPVIGYHNISSDSDKKNLYLDNPYIVSETEFNNQMQILNDLQYKVLTGDEFYQWMIGEYNPPKNSVLITFDDGMNGLTKYGVPILEQLDFTAISFNSGYHVETNDNYLNVDEIKSTAKTIEHASHGHSLHSGTKVTDENNKSYYVSQANLLSPEEIDDDFVRMDKLVNSKFFAYPYGIYDKDIETCLEKYNYKMAFAWGNDRVAKRSDGIWFINRFGIYHNLSNEDFIDIIDN